MRFLAILVLISALAIASCAAFFSVTGLMLLFVGGGTSIVVMGIALEIGKLVVATVLHHQWKNLSLWLKGYLLLATLTLMVITSFGIYGYLSAGYNATALQVKAYEQQIESNNKKINQIKESDKQNIATVLNDANIENINKIEQKYNSDQLSLISQNNSTIEQLRVSIEQDKLKASRDLTSAQNALDNDINREIKQIDLYNNRLQILDKEVQTWLSEGQGGAFKTNGIKKAREVKESQGKERDSIDAEIKLRQANISLLRINFNTRVKEIDERLKETITNTEARISLIEKSTTDIKQNIEVHSKQTNSDISSQNNLKETAKQQIKTNSIQYQHQIDLLLNSNNTIQQSINETDVGTFKFVAKNLGLDLNTTVNYFIIAIMFVFDPLAIGLVLCFNHLISLKKPKLSDLNPPSQKSDPKPILPVIQPPVITEPVKVVEDISILRAPPTTIGTIQTPVTTHNGIRTSPDGVIG